MNSYVCNECGSVKYWYSWDDRRVINHYTYCSHFVAKPGWNRCWGCNRQVSHHVDHEPSCSHIRQVWNHVDHEPSCFQISDLPLNLDDSFPTDYSKRQRDGDENTNSKRQRDHHNNDIKNADFKRQCRQR